MRAASCVSAWLCVAAVVAVTLAAGCGRRTAEQSPQRSPAQKSEVPLPEWAPENPSEEFLRAARVLKPMPLEVYTQAVEGDQVMEAFAERFQRTFPLSYELFGALSDRQIEQFRSKRVIYVPVKSLTPRQRAALDRWFEAWRETMAGTAPRRQMEYMNDYLVHLYKIGAREDLSNVDLGFDASADLGVDLLFRIRGPDGTMLNQCAVRFAMLD